MLMIPYTDLKENLRFFKPLYFRLIIVYFVDINSSLLLRNCLNAEISLNDVHRVSAIPTGINSIYDKARVSSDQIRTEHTHTHYIAGCKFFSVAFGGSQNNSVLQAVKKYWLIVLINCWPQWFSTAKYCYICDKHNS
jgi:hypothetical protein